MTKTKLHDFNILPYKNLLYTINSNKKTIAFVHGTHMGKTVIIMKALKEVGRLNRILFISNKSAHETIESNNEYGLDKHIKQKLLDRMNKATNNWNYVFKANNKNVKNNKNSNKKILIENLSEIMMSPDKNDFINNNTIISDESEDEKDKNNS